MCSTVCKLNIVRQLEEFHVQEIKNKDLHNRYWGECLEIMFQDDLLNKKDENMHIFMGIYTPDLYQFVLQAHVSTMIHLSLILL